ncbi:MAG: glycerophosphodiester phosphodiesterase [Muribaculaceae bacterium]
MTAIIIFSAVVLVAVYVAAIFVPSMFFYKRGYTTEKLAGKLIVAHRGGAKLAPENSLLAIEKGIQCGADIIEIDIHQSRDGELIVCHDPTLDRTTTGKGKIADLTLDEIKRFSIVDQNSNATNERIATLQQVLDLVESYRAKGRNVGLLIEIKHVAGQYQGIEKRLVIELSRRDALSWCSAQSFDDGVLFTLHSLCPTLQLEKLLICPLPGLPFIVDGFGISRFSFEKYGFVNSFNCMWQGVNHKFVEQAHANGKEVKLWTFDDLNAAVVDADGFITDRPDIWQNARKRFGN